MRIVNIFGTRPQYIKVASMNRALADDSVCNINVGRDFSYNMSGIFSDSFKIDIHYKCDNIRKIRYILDKFNPDFVLIYGDTKSSWIGALSARYHKMVHIESGLRCNIEATEELIRLGVDHLADIRFVPVVSAIDNLNLEGLDGIFSGDIMCDILKVNESRLTRINTNYVYMTLHRKFNVDSMPRMRALLDSLGNINQTIVFPMHPRTRKMLTTFGLPMPMNVMTCDPLGYLENLCNIKFADCVITDSGGMQKEAYLLKTPCVSVMPDTQWKETILDNFNILSDPMEVHMKMTEIMGKKDREYHNHFGFGDASFRIRTSLEKYVQ